MWPGVGIPPRAVGLERFPQGFLQGVIFSPAGLVSQGERLAVQQLSDFIRNQRLQILQVVSPHQVQGISGIDQFQVPHRHLVSRRIRPQSRIALTQAAGVALPHLSVSRFHVEQRPVQCLPPVSRPTVQHRLCITRHDMNREITGQIGKTLYRLASRMNGITALSPLDADSYRTPFRAGDMPDQSEQLLVLADLAIGIGRTKGSHPSQTMYGFQQTRLAGSIGTCDEIEPATECQAGFPDIPEIGYLKRQQTRYTGRRGFGLVGNGNRWCVRARSETHGHDNVTAFIITGLGDKGTAVGITKMQIDIRTINGAKHIEQVGNVETDQH